MSSAPLPRNVTLQDKLHMACPTAEPEPLSYKLHDYVTHQKRVSSACIRTTLSAGGLSVSTGIKLWECPVSGGRRSDMMTLWNMRGAAADIYLIFRPNKNNVIYTRLSVVPDERLMIATQEINVSWNGGSCFVDRKTSIGLGQCDVWYNMNDQGFSVRLWAGEKIFLFIAYIRLAAECKSFVSNDQATQPERNATYSPPSGAKSWEPLEMSLHKT